MIPPFLILRQRIVSWAVFDHFTICAVSWGLVAWETAGATAAAIASTLHSGAEACWRSARTVSAFDKERGRQDMSLKRLPCCVFVTAGDVFYFLCCFVLSPPCSSFLSHSCLLPPCNHVAALPLNPAFPPFLVHWCFFDSLSLGIWQLGVWFILWEEVAGSGLSSRGEKS